MWQHERKGLGKQSRLCECPSLGRGEMQVACTEDFTFACSDAAFWPNWNQQVETWKRLQKANLRAKGKSLPAVLFGLIPDFEWKKCNLIQSHPPFGPQPTFKKTWCPHVVTWILSRSHLRFDTQSQSNGGPRRGCQRLGGQIFFVWALAIMAGSGSDGTVNEGCPLWCLMPTNLTTSVDSTVLGKIHNAAVDLTWSDGCQVFFTLNIMQIYSILGETMVVSPKKSERLQMKHACGMKH